MSLVSRASVAPWLIVVALGAAACEEAPDKEMQQAKIAIETARVAGADVYAREEFNAAQDALKRAGDAITDRDYRLALNDALDARDRAQTATREASEQKAAARANAEHLLREATTALDDAHGKLKAADGVRTLARAVAPHRATITSGEQAVQKARAAFERGDYPAVAPVLTSIMPRLQAASRDLEALTAGTGSRRRRS